MEDSVVPNDENNDDGSLYSDIDPPQNNILETEGVGRMGNEAEESEIEGVDSETEALDSYNEGVENEVLTPDRKGIA